MLSFKDFSPRPIRSSMIKEELTPKQKNIVDGWAGGSHSVMAAIASQGVIPNNQDRVTTPLIHPETPAIPHPDVKEHLERNGYSISDYRAGKAIDPYNRETNIGKALAKTKADPSVINAFANDPNRAASKQAIDDNLHVVISRNAHDVAGMSTDRGWTSCMNMAGGSNAHYLKPAVEEGMHVAYLARKDDPELQNPLARIAMVPYRPFGEDGLPSGKRILRPEKTQYGTSDSAFADTVKNWTNQNFPIQEGLSYYRNQDVYNDRPNNPGRSSWVDNLNYDTSKLASFDTLMNSNKPGDKAHAMSEYPERVTPEHIKSAIDDYKNVFPTAKTDANGVTPYEKHIPQLTEAVNHPSVTQEQLNDVYDSPGDHGKAAVASSTILGSHPALINKIINGDNKEAKNRLFSNHNIKLTPEQINKGLESKDQLHYQLAINHPSFHESNFETASKHFQSTYDLNPIARRMGYSNMKQAIASYKAGNARPNNPIPVRRPGWMEPDQKGPYLDPENLPWKESYNLNEGFLSDYQNSVVKRWRKGPAALNISSHVIPPGQDSVRIPLTPPEKPVEPHPDVKQHLEDNGFAISDYRTGTATDKYGRDTTIGRALGKTKAPPSLVSKFVNDPNRAQSTNPLSDYVMHISRKPTDIARCSTNQGWRSCMRMPEYRNDPDAGENYHFLKGDVANGTHVAYLAHKDDLQAENPVARILLKPYNTIDHVYNDTSDWQKNNPSHTILRPEETTYGTADNAFGDAVKKWTESNFRALPGRMYGLGAGLYPDQSRYGRRWDSNPPIGDSAAVNNLFNTKATSERILPVASGNGYKTTNDVGALRSQIIKSGDMTPEHIDNIIKTNNPEEHQALAQRSDINLSPSQYGQLINKNTSPQRSSVLYNLTNNRNLPSSVLDQMVQHRSPMARMYAAGSRFIKPEHIATLLNDKNTDVKMSLGENRALRTDDVSKLLKDKSYAVRSSVLKHPWASTSDLQNALSTETDSWNRQAIQSHLNERKKDPTAHASKLAVNYGATGDEIDKVLGPGTAAAYYKKNNGAKPPQFPAHVLDQMNMMTPEERSALMAPMSEGKVLKFSEYMITEERKDPDSTTLHSFDMDETLMAHDHNKLRVHVMDPNGKKVRTLSNQEFNTHQLPPGHSYDFSEFRSSDVFGQSASPIRKMIAKLKAIHKNNKNVEILTARGDMDDKDKFAHHMQKYGIDINQIHVRRAGNMPGKPADTKAAVMSNLINQNGYKKVHLYDDSVDNLNAFLKLKRQHPEVEFNAHHVRHDPETGNVVVTSRKV